jgi:anti-sigma factor ChrR (cupin superfamily)
MQAAIAEDTDRADPNAEVLLRVARKPWVEFAPGIEFKTLRTSAETGVWTVVFRCAKGSAFPAHFHHGAGEYLMLKGRMDYRMGVADAGDYGYEPLGSFHELTIFIEDSELLFTNHGPVAFLDENQGVKMILDWKFFADRA